MNYLGEGLQVREQFNRQVLEAYKAKVDGILKLVKEYGRLRAEVERSAGEEPDEEGFVAAERESNLVLARIEELLNGQG